MTYVLGLTGGIGSGKSTLSDFFKELGFKIIDADIVAREVVKKDSLGLKQIVAVFGQEVLAFDQTLDRKKLGALVFNDSEKLTQLNEIVHPLVKKTMLEKLALEKEQGAKVVVLEVPLLFETGYEKYCDAVVNVYVNKELQVKRIMERDHLSENEANKRIESQLAAEKRKEKATFTVDSSGTVEQTRAQVIKWLKINKLIES